MRKFILLLACLLLIGGTVSAIEVTSKKKNTLSIDTKILLGTVFDFDYLNWEFSTPDIGLEIAGDFDDNFGFNTSFDVSGAIKGDMTDLLEDAYVYFNFPRDIQLTIGQMKVPFGEEATISRTKRAYQSHSMGSGDIAPGRDRGVGFSINDLFGFLNIDAGVFNGLGTVYEDITLNNVLISSKQSLKLDLSLFFVLELGYGIFFEVTEANIPVFELGHDIYGKIDFELTFDKKLFFLVEYMEKHLIRNIVNDREGWTYDLFATLGFAVEKWEFFTTFDVMRLNSMYNMPDDSWVATGGVNYRPYDDVKFALFYEGEYFYNNEDYKHKAGVNVYIKL